MIHEPVPRLTYHLGGTTVEVFASWVRTTLPDGAQVHAIPMHGDEHQARASVLGYGEGDAAVLAMTLEHDLTHVQLAHMLGLRESPALRLATRGEESELAGLEECAVLARAGVPLRVPQGRPAVTLPTLKHGVPMLQQQARMLTVENVNPRPRGRAWMQTRVRVQVEQGSRCVDCGRLWMPELDQVDHDVPREQGGSDDDSNLRLRCIDCAKAKTRREAAQRIGGSR